MENVVLQPIDLGLPLMKEIGAIWLEKMAQYISDNPQFIVNGFVRAGICRALDGCTSDDELDGLLEEMDKKMTNQTSLSSDDKESSNDNDDGHTGYAVVDEQVVHTTTPPIVLYSDSSDDNIC